MTVKQNTYDDFTNYEEESEAAIERSSTNAGALECCCSAFVLKNIGKYMGMSSSIARLKSTWLQIY